MGKKQKNLLVGLDIGTAKVLAIVGEMMPDGSLAIIGYGAQPSKGMKRGVVINIETMEQAIQVAVEEAELMAGCQIHSAYTGIADSQVRGFNSHGVVGVRNAQEVVNTDVERVLEAAKAVAIPAEQHIIHVLPQSFILDRQEGIRQPIGMSGVRLESKVHLILSAVASTQNLLKSIQRCQLDVSHLILKQLAASYATLNEDEKALGVCLIDMGAGTTNIIVFAEGAIQHTAVLPLGGDQVTNDIAIALRLSTAQAEALKLEAGSVLPHLIPPTEEVAVPLCQPGREKQIAKRFLAEVIEPRCEEILALVQSNLAQAGIRQPLSAGIVLTGGGANMKGMVELTERLFEMPVRIGVAQRVQGFPELTQNPAYASGIGLLLYGIEQEGTILGSDLPGHPVKKGVFGRMKQWFQGNF